MSETLTVDVLDVAGGGEILTALKAGIDPALIEDLILGCGNPEGMQGKNLGRQTVLRAELPDESLKGVTFYAVMRMLQIRPTRIPKPRVRIGGRPK